MFRVFASHDGRGVNANTNAFLLSPAWGCAWHSLQRGASNLVSSLCSPQSVKWAGRLVWAPDWHREAIVLPLPFLCGEMSYLHSALLLCLGPWLTRQCSHDLVALVVRFVFAGQWRGGSRSGAFQSCILLGARFSSPWGFCVLWQTMLLQKLLEL